MKPETLLKHFEDLSERLGIKVLRGKGDFQGGSCVVKKENVVVLNSIKPIEQRLRVLAQGIMQKDLSDIYMVPAVRDYIERAQATVFQNATQNSTIENKEPPTKTNNH